MSKYVGYIVKVSSSRHHNKRASCRYNFFNRFPVRFNTRYIKYAADFENHFICVAKFVEVAAPVCIMKITLAIVLVVALCSQVCLVACSTSTSTTHSPITSSTQKTWPQAFKDGLVSIIFYYNFKLFNLVFVSSVFLRLCNPR